MIAAILDKQCKEVAPIYGVSIGRKDDKLSWRISFKDEATEEEINAAQSVIDNFNMEDVVKEEDLQEKRVIAMEAIRKAQLDNSLLPEVVAYRTARGNGGP